LVLRFMTDPYARTCRAALHESLLLGRGWAKVTFRCRRLVVGNRVGKRKRSLAPSQVSLLFSSKRRSVFSGFPVLEVRELLAKIDRGSRREKTCSWLRPRLRRRGIYSRHGQSSTRQRPTE